MLSSTLWVIWVYSSSCQQHVITEVNRLHKGSEKQPCFVRKYKKTAWDQASVNKSCISLSLGLLDLWHMQESLLLAFYLVGKGKEFYVSEMYCAFFCACPGTLLACSTSIWNWEGCRSVLLDARACAYGEDYPVCCISYGLAQLSPGGRCFEAPFPVGAEPGLAADAQWCST